jgi:penicillin-binding protein 1C
MKRILVVVALAFGCLGVALFRSAELATEARGFFASGTSMPVYEDIRAATRPSDLKLLDRRGRVLHEIRTDPKRRRFGWVALADISPALRSAVVAAEDRRFFAHAGVDAPALVAASARWLSGGHARGASTITMQLAAFLDEDLRRGLYPRRFDQKWRQMRSAWALERRWSKDEILEAYLNLVSFRGEVQGIGAASAVLFGKSPHALSQAEAAVLAALIRGPNAAPPMVAKRARAVLDAVGANEPIEHIDSAVSRASGDPHRSLERKAAAHVARRLLPPGTPADDVRSTLDLDTQLVAGAALHRALLALHDRRVSDGAVLVVDNASGDVLAYVGSSGDLSLSPHVDGVQARRQPGSALKPFLYSLALEEHLLTAASLLDDSPLEIAVATGLYRPENYDERFRGWVSVRTALAASLNIPAVRALQLVGEHSFATHLRQLGFEGVTRPGSYYGPALALGSAEVSLWEIVNAYRTLANGGQASALRLVADQESPGRRIYSAAAAFVTSSILADRESRSATFGLENPLSTRFWAAVKTGTSKDMRDNWCIGYSSRFTVGVWVGNFSGYPMGNVSGVSGAAPVWLEVMEWLHRDATSAEPRAPEGLVQHAVAFAAPAEVPRLEWFLEQTAPVGTSGLPARHPARIVAPTDSTIIAVDPEIPASRQRVAFEAERGNPSISWVLNGTKLGPSTEPILWPPTPGRYQLRLVDDVGRTLDELAFCVRGNT